MHQLGNCPGALKTLNLQRRRGGLFGRAALGAALRSTPGEVRPPNTRVQRTRVLAVARNARALRALARSPLTRHPLGACLTLDGPRRAGLSSRPRLRPVAWSAWCVAEGSGWESSATSEELRAPRACAMRADERGGRGRAAGWLVLALGNSTLNVSARPPAQSAPLRRAGGKGTYKSNRASRRIPWSRPGASRRHRGV
jgi:hypothetical protein